MPGQRSSLTHAMQSSTPTPRVIAPDGLNITLHTACTGQAPRLQVHRAGDPRNRVNIAAPRSILHRHDGAISKSSFAQRISSISLAQRQHRNHDCATAISRSCSRNSDIESRSHNGNANIALWLHARRLIRPPQFKSHARNQGSG